MSNRELLAIHSGDCGESWRNNIERSQRDGKEENLQGQKLWLTD